MTTELCDAMRVYVRYETERPDGETRREFNERFGKDSPDFELPEDGVYLWDLYWGISEGVQRFQDGLALPIAWSEFKAWAELTQECVLPDEYAILRAIDAVWVEQTNIELEAMRKTEQEKARLAAQQG